MKKAILPVTCLLAMQANAQNISQIIEDSNSHNSHFDQSMKRMGLHGKIESCSILLSIPGGRNNSYGGYCHLQNAKDPVEICDSEMTNAFDVKYSFADKDELVQFTTANCVGG